MKKSQQLKLRIININSQTTSGEIELQGAWDVKYLYRIIKNYFEKELLSSSEQLTDTHLQTTLNKKANSVALLREFTFDDDIRIIELAILIGILESLNKLGGLSKNYAFVPAWQKPNQKTNIKNHFKKESWDGLIIGIPKDSKEEVIPIPLELKSLMTNPRKSVEGNPNEQLKKQLRKFTKHFQHEGSLNCVLAMPYTNEQNLSIDLKEATDDLRSAITSKAAGFVSLLTFPHDKEGRLAMSILFAIVSQDTSFMTATNTDKWMCQLILADNKAGLCRSHRANTPQ